MADVVEEDISAGSQDEEMTRHHSSSLRGPRPRPRGPPPPAPPRLHTPPINATHTPSPTDIADTIRET